MDNTIFLILLLATVISWIFIIFIIIKLYIKRKENKMIEKIINDPDKLIKKLNENKFREKIGTEENEISFYIKEEKEEEHKGKGFFKKDNLPKKKIIMQVKKVNEFKPKIKKDKKSEEESDDLKIEEDRIPPKEKRANKDNKRK